MSVCLRLIAHFRFVFIFSFPHSSINQNSFSRRQTRNQYLVFVILPNFSLSQSASFQVSPQSANRGLKGYSNATSIPSQFRVIERKTNCFEMSTESYVRSSQPVGGPARMAAFNPTGLHLTPLPRTNSEAP